MQKEKSRAIKKKVKAVSKFFSAEIYKNVEILKYTILHLLDIYVIVIIRAHNSSFYFFDIRGQ